MNIGNWTIDLWWLWGIIIVALIVVFSRIHREGPVKNWWDKFILKLPIFGALTNAAEMNRFIKTIAILIKNHVGLLETVDIGKRVIQNNSVRTTFSDLAHELRSGSGLSEALKKSSYMPVEALQMLKVGEESGQMGEMLGEASEELERRMKVKIKRLLALFEPAVILFLASIITLVIISIFMAILEMNEIN
jgi:general secretion pathway protein F